LCEFNHNELIQRVFRED